MSTLQSESQNAMKDEWGGGFWKYRLYFTVDEDVDVDPHRPPPTRIEVRSDQLISYFNQVPGTNEQIETISIWKNNLGSCIPKWLGLWHEFTLVESQNWWWSFEKDDQGICVQRGALKNVKESYGGVQRTGTVEPEGRPTLRGKENTNIIDIFKWILEEQFIEKAYHATDSNCHYFASLAYEEFAEQLIRPPSNFLLRFLNRHLQSLGRSALKRDN